MRCQAAAVDAAGDLTSSASTSACLGPMKESRKPTVGKGMDLE